MASKKNKAGKTSIQAVVNISGKIDPSLTKVINQVSGQMSKLATNINKSFDKANKSIASTAKLSQNVGKAFGNLTKSASKTSGQITQLFNKANKSITNTNKSLGKSGKAGSKAASGNKSQAASSNGKSSNNSNSSDTVSKLGESISTSVISIGKQGLQLALNLQKVQGSVDTTFGSSANQINNWSKNASKSFGLSELEAKQFSSNMGKMLKNTGVSSEDIVEMSENLAGLSGQIASVNSISKQDAFKKIQAGISGDEKSVKELGIDMSEANLQQYALTNGSKVSYKNMDDAAKTQLRYQYIMSKSKDVQDAYKKSQGNLQNQVQLMKMNFDQLIATGFSKMLPLLEKGIQIADKFVNGPYQPVLMGLIATIGLLGGKILLFGKVIPSILSAFEIIRFLNPQFILISLAIGAVIAIGWCLYKNWSTISKNIVGVWQNDVMPFFNGIEAWFSGIWDGVVSNFKGFINWIIDGVNSLIKSLNSIKINVPDWVPKLGGKQLGINISLIPHFADGGIASSPSIFGEAGPEMAIPLQRNSRSMGLLSQTANILGVDKGNGGPNVTVNLTINSSDGNPRTIAEAAEDAIIGVIEKYFGDKARVAYGE